MSQQLALLPYNKKVASSIPDLGPLFSHSLKTQISHWRGSEREWFLVSVLPCKELATCPRSTVSSPYDSRDRLQPTP